MLSPADLSLLGTLDVLLQESSVSRAAARLRLSTPAMSHALARIRAELDDPILVRAGRRMVLTPRAEAMKTKVRAAVALAEDALRDAAPMNLATLDREITVFVSDYVITIIGVELDGLLRQAAPGVRLRFVPNSVDDPANLREGAGDVAIGIYDKLPPELRTRQLLTDRFVCVVREANSYVRNSLSLTQYTQLEHVQIAPRGRPGGSVDTALAAVGLSRRVVRTVPFFLAALRLVAKTDYILTVSERIAKLMAPCLGLRILEPPIAVRPYALRLVWHPRFEADRAHAWVRNAFVRAAKLAAGDSHANPERTLPRPPRSSRKRKGRAV